MLRKHLQWFLVLSMSFGCQAVLGESGDVSPGADLGVGVLGDLGTECRNLGEGIHPGPAPIRRLTHFEYDSTVADLTGVAGTHSEALPPEARALGFHGIAAAQSVSHLLVEGYEKAAAEIAGAMTADVPGLLGCDPSSQACVDDFVREFGGHAYRRPLSDAEVGRMAGVFAWGRDHIDVSDGVRMVLEVFLQSPDFLYRPELGAEEVAPGVQKLTSYEMASRLSYLFLGSMPDDALLTKAAEGRLGTKEEILVEARRLLATEAAHGTIRRFHSEWLDLPATENIQRDPAVYPGYHDAVPGLQLREAEAFIDHVVFRDEGTLARLLTAPYTLMNAELAAFYGATGPAGAEFEVVPLDGTLRAGLLSQGALLAHHAQPLQTSPVHRGKFIRESLLCQFLEPPPADLVIQPPDLDPNLTTRERFNQHSADRSCSGCHRLMDPVGLAFENFDPVGRFRAEENGKPVDASGELVATDVDGAFVGAVELGTKLAASEEVRTCVTRQWVRFAQGRSETPEDACSLVALGTTFRDSGGNILGLLEALTQTDAFLYKKVVTP